MPPIRLSRCGCSPIPSNPPPQLRRVTVKPPPPVQSRGKVLMTVNANKPPLYGKGENMRRNIKKRTYNNFMTVCRAVMGKGYDLDTAADITRQIFDNLEQNGVSVWRSVDLIIDAAEHEKRVKAEKLRKLINENGVSLRDGLSLYCNDPERVEKAARAYKKGLVSFNEIAAWCMN